MMAQTTLEREIMILSETQSQTEIHSTKAVSWSNDNKAVICCAEKIVILNLVAGPLLTPIHPAISCSVEETPDISHLGKFSVASGLLKYKDSLKQLNDYERQRLLADPSLVEDFLYPLDSLKAFKHAIFAPVCFHVTRPQSVIAAVTYDHRVILFEHGSEGWNVLVELSPILKEHTISAMHFPVTLPTDMSLQSYTETVYNMCIVEIEWSHCLTRYKKPEEHYILFFTGTRGGQVYVWMSRYPLESRDSISISHTDTYTSEVTSLSWLSKESDRGFLSVGYLDGSVRILEISLESDAATPKVRVAEMFADLTADDLSISDMTWIHMNQTQSVLVVCKQYFLLLFSTCNDSFSLVNHIHMDITLPLTCISTFGAQGVLCSQDGSIFTFTCDNKSGKPDLCVSSLNLSSLTHSSQVQWYCMGHQLSPISGLCLSVHMMNHGCKLNEKRNLTLHRQSVVLSFPFKYTADHVKELVQSLDSHMSPQSIMITLRLHVQQVLQTNGSLQDFIDFLTELSTSKDLTSLQIARDMHQFLKHCTNNKVEYKEEMKEVKISHEEISEKLLRTHVQFCLQEVPAKPCPAELAVIKAMLAWISQENSRSAEIGNKVDLSKLAHISRQATVEPCIICGSELTVTELLMARCTKGHKIKLCSLSLLPCQKACGRSCESCGQPAISLSDLSDVRFIKQRSLCTMCGAVLWSRIS